GQALPTYSSMTAKVQRLQLVHSATSMIMFHFCMALTFLSAPGWPFAWSLRRYELRGFQRLAHLLVLLHPREGFRHVLGPAVPEFDLHQRIGASDRVGRFRLCALRREQVEAASPIDRFAGLAHRIVDRRRLVAMAHAARQP